MKPPPGRATLLVALLLVGTTTAAAAAVVSHHEQHKARPCSWGASSVTARLVGGMWIVGKPHATGCIPQP